VNLEEIGFEGVDLILLAQDRDQCFELGNFYFGFHKGEEVS
jgi:hypothetical protein